MSILGINEYFQIIAKNLLLQNSCENCSHKKERQYRGWSIIFQKQNLQNLDNLDNLDDYVCCSILRAKKEKNLDITSNDWKTFKECGLIIPKEKICEFGEWQ